MRYYGKNAGVEKGVFMMLERSRRTESGRVQCSARDGEENMRRRQIVKAAVKQEEASGTSEELETASVGWKQEEEAMMTKRYSNSPRAGTIGPPRIVWNHASRSCFAV